MTDLEVVKPGKCNVRKKNGQLCKMSAGQGTDHVGSGPCKLHGGTLPTVSIHHRRKLIEEAIQVRTGSPLEIDPEQALLEEVWRTAGRVVWIREQISRMEQGELTERTMGGAKLSVWIEWEQKERRFLVEASKTCIAAGIAERQVKLAEAQGAIVAEAFRKLMEDPELKLTAEQKAAAPAVMRRVLSLVG